MLEPFPNETQSEFAIRFHESLKDAIPNTDERDKRMIQTWRKSRGPNRLQNTAISRFARDHEYHPDRPVFAEHTTEDSEGNVVVYDRNALVSILNRNNERIEDTGDFSPITEGHTPTRMALSKGAKMPSVLGYSGPYRLGMIGNKNPRWAIFADEWHDKQDVAKLRKLRRRSPEVWLEERMEDRFFDPIAALGAEAPRLDMGMTFYSQRDDGTRVRKYSAAAFPAAETVFVKDDGDQDDYAADQPSDDISPEKAQKILDDGTVHGEPLTEDQRRMFQAAANRKDYQSGENDMATGELGPETVQQIVDAIMATEPMQYVVSMMEGGSAPGKVESEPEPKPEPAAAPGGGGEMEGANGNGNGNGAAAATAPENGEGVREYLPDDDDRQMMSRYMAGDMDDEEYAQYMAGKRKSYMAGDDHDDDDPDKDEYARRQKERKEKSRYAKMEAELEETRNRLQAIEQEKESTERYSKLQELRTFHAFDLEKEMDRCSPKKMSREAFEDHLDVISENYEKIPTGGMMPRLHDSSDGAIERSRGAYTEDQCKQAERYALSEREKGNNVSWNDALEHVAGKTA